MTFRVLALLCIVAPLAAQAPAAAASAPVTIPPAAEQVAAAVQPLPPELRDGAMVLGYDAGGKLVTLRAGTNDMHCLADDPAEAARFHVACYHKALEPFMARGRALRAAGTTGDQVDSVRFREVRSGRLALPRGAWSLYSLTGGTWDPAARTLTGARPLYVLYMPYATVQSTGLSDKPGKGPWLMFPGTPKAHLMLTPTM
ncbi:MAG: hypothetical protein MUF21_01230 [Gemmatimonadaceae bacterium]|nr:hypothetical protein [Gemmatimonadaceae bacterium]